MKIREVFIKDYKVFKDFKINFCDENDKPLDIIVIAGINGSGKTTLLEFFYYTLTKRGFNNEKDWVTVKINDNNENIKLDVKLIKILYKNHLYNDELENFLNNMGKKIFYLKAEILESKNAKNKIVEYLKNLVWKQEVSPKEAYKQIQKILQNIFNDFNLQIEFNTLDENEEVFFKNEFNDKIKIDDLSTGEKELITKAFSLYLSDIEDSVILIDEPETSLHPSWQNRILSVYEMIAKEKNSQIIIATHSPQIIASAKKESIRLLKKDGNKIEAYSLSQNPVSSDVNGILSEVMESSYLPLELKEAQERYLKLVEDGKVETKEAQKELDIILQYESNTSKFLQRINFYLRHKKRKK